MYSSAKTIKIITIQLSTEEEIESVKDCLNFCRDLLTDASFNNQKEKETYLEIINHFTIAF